MEGFLPELIDESAPSIHSISNPETAITPKVASVAELKAHLANYLSADSSEGLEGVRLIEATNLADEYGKQYRFLNDERLAGVMVAVIPDRLWRKGLQPSESDADRGLVLFREGYFNNQQQTTRDEIAWMTHELAHCQRQKDRDKNYNTDAMIRAMENISVEVYPNNKNEEYAFTKQLEYLKGRGMSKNRVLKLLKGYYDDRDIEFLKKLIEKVFI